MNYATVEYDLKYIENTYGPEISKIFQTLPDEHYQFTQEEIRQKGLHQVISEKNELKHDKAKIESVFNAINTINTDTKYILVKSEKKINPNPNSNWLVKGFNKITGALEDIGHAETLLFGLENNVSPTVKKIIGGVNVAAITATAIYTGGLALGTLGAEGAATTTATSSPFIISLMRQFDKIENVLDKGKVAGKYVLDKGKTITKVAFDKGKEIGKVVLETTEEIAEKVAGKEFVEEFKEGVAEDWNSVKHCIGNVCNFLKNCKDGVCEKTGPWIDRAKKMLGIEKWYKIDFLEKDGTIKHIFKNDPGHLTYDTPENRKLLLDLVNDAKNFIGTDKHGSKCFTKTLENGKQLWAEVWGNEIRNGGINNNPIYKLKK